jgi:hypothetical protein
MSKNDIWYDFQEDMRKTGRSPKKIKRSWKRKGLPKPKKDIYYFYG